MNRTIAIADAATTPATVLGLVVSSASGRQVRGDQPEHGAGGEPEADRQERGEFLDEEECGDRHQRLGEAREHAPGGGRARRRPPRHEDEADREALGDVVHGDCQADQDPQALLDPEGDAHSDAFREGVDRHDPDDQERLCRIGPLE